MITLTTESFEELKNRHDLTHWHDTIELLRVTTGKMQCVINGEVHVLNEGDICIINTQQLHRVRYDGSDCIFQRLTIDPALFVSNKAVYHQYLLPLLTDPAFAHVMTGKREAAEFSCLLDRMAEAIKEAAVGYELELVAIVYLLFRRLFFLYQAQKGKSGAPSSANLVLFRRMADFIYQRFSDKLGLPEIAASGNVSKSKCGAVFNEYAGHSPVDFLNLYRLKVSEDALSTLDMSIAEIAAYCGFGQQSYYNRLFLREYGITPTEYRKSSWKQTVPTSIR